MTGTLASYQRIAANIDRSVAALSQRPDIKRCSDYFLANIGKAQTIDDFLDDERLYHYAMTAYGLQDMIYGKAFMRELLAKRVDPGNVFALQLSDQRLRDFVDGFNFLRHGAAGAAFDKAWQATVERYLRVQLETDAGRQDEGLRMALYFQRMAPNVSTVFGLLSDRVLCKVLQTALGLPAVRSNGDIDAQAALVGSQVSIDDFKDPERLNTFIGRFAARWQAVHGPSGEAPPWSGRIRSRLATFDNLLLLGMQNLKGPRP